MKLALALLLSCLFISLSPIGRAGESRKLLELAQQRFSSGLSPAEKEMFIAAENGRDAYCYFSGNSNVTDAPNWSADRVIAADKILWLCSDPAASELVSHRGVEIRGARIENELHLDGVRVPFSIRTYQCCS
jgi:hypothetical protein